MLDKSAISQTLGSLTLARDEVPEIAFNEIDRLIAASVRFDTVLADAGYDGLSAAFRQALSGNCLTWAVDIPKYEDSSGKRVSNATTPESPEAPGCS